MVRTESKSWRRRYAVAVYLVVALGGGLAVLASLRVPNGQDASAAVLGIGASLVATGLTFVILSAFLLDRDHEVLDRLEELSSPSGGIALHSRQQAGLTPLLDALRTATEARALGYALDRFVDDAETELLNFLIKGGSARLLVVRSGGKAEAAVRAIADSEHYLNRVHRTLAALERVRQAAPGAKIEVRSVDWNPSCALYFASGRMADLLQVEIYPPNYNTSPGARPTFVLDASSEWYEFFDSQFEQLWAVSATWPPPTQLPQLMGT